MKALRVAVLVVVLALVPACGDDSSSEQATEQLDERVDEVRRAAEAHDAVAFAAATEDLRGVVDVLRVDGGLSEEKAASVLALVADVERKFLQAATPPTTTTTVAPTTTAPAPSTTTSPPVDDEEGPPRGKGKDKHNDD